MKIVLFYVVLLMSPLTFAQGIIIPPGKKFYSPDQSCSIKLENHWGDYRYVIMDRDGKIDAVLTDDYTPVFAIAWGPDSQSIYAVEHESGGSLVQILHLSNNKWKKFTIDVPDENAWTSTVISWNIHSDKLSLFCKATVQKGNKGDYTFYKCNFDVNPATGQTSNFRKTPLTLEELYKLKSNFVPE